MNPNVFSGMSDIECISVLLYNHILMFSYTYQYMSKFMIILVSVMLDTGNGCANLATAINSLWLLYKPTVVTYGLKYEPVAKSEMIPLFELPEMSVGFCENVNSFWRNVHLYCVSYMVVCDWNEQVKLFDSIQFNMVGGFGCP